MPIYEYNCKKCDAIFEKLLINSGDDILPKCPECNSSRCDKVISQSSFRLMGNGWYQGHGRDNNENSQ